MELKLREVQAIKVSPFPPKEHLALSLKNGQVSIEEAEADIKQQQQVIAMQRLELRVAAGLNSMNEDWKAARKAKKSDD